MSSNTDGITLKYERSFVERLLDKLERLEDGQSSELEQFINDLRVQLKLPPIDFHAPRRI